MRTKRPSVLGKDYLQLLASSNLADIDIICNGRTWKAHSVVLCARSKWFNTALTGRWKERESRQVCLQDVDHKTVDMILGYLYGEVLPNERCECVDKKSCDCATLEDLVRLLIAANFFMLDNFSAEVEDMVRRMLAEQICSLFTFNRNKIQPDAELFTQDSKGHDQLSKFITQMQKTIRLVYTVKFTDSAKMQRLLTSTVAAAKHHMPSKVIRTLADEIPAFASDLLSFFLAANSDLDFMHALEIRTMWASCRFPDQDVPKWLKDTQTHVRTCLNYDCPNYKTAVWDSCITVDPLSAGRKKGCVNCRQDLVETQLDNCVRSWPRWEDKNDDDRSATIANEWDEEYHEDDEDVELEI